MFRRAPPGRHSELDRLLGEGDIVVERFTAGGAHDGGALMGVEPTGRTIVLAGITALRIRDDRIVERWGRLDEVGPMRRLQT